MKNLRKISKNKGFTLIEILVVIGIIAILAAIVIIAINPARQFAQARNTQREANVNAILNAIGQNIADNKGTFNCAYGLPASTTVKNIDNTNANIGPCLTPTYIPTLPVDPGITGAHWTDSTNYDTKYTVATDAVGRVTVCAPGGVEPAIAGSISICVTR
jgi:type IV pilus assembly protein PilA